MANVYRVARGSTPPLYLVDLPGYGYARGGDRAAEEFEVLTRDYFARGHASGILLVDARHPGLTSDRRAWQWIHGAVVGAAAVVATKIDKLARGERMRAMRVVESVFDTSVLPVSAVTGEGLDQLWRMIERLANSRGETAEPPPRPRPRRN